MAHEKIYGVCENKCFVETVPKNHADAAGLNGTGTSSKYGHVRLSDSTTSTSNVGSGTAATPSAVKSVADRVTVLEKATSMLDSSTVLKTVVNTYAELSNLTNLSSGDKVLCWEYVSNLPRLYTYNGSSWTAKANGEVPRSLIEYSRADNGQKMTFYRVQPDTTNYINIVAGYDENKIEDTDYLYDNDRLSVLSLNPNCYVIGSISAYCVKNMQMNSSSSSSITNDFNSKNDVIFTDCTTLPKQTVNLTTTAQNIVIPAKTNGIVGYCYLRYGTNGDRYNVYSSTKIGFKAA